jgi:hypothetical protein
MLQVAEERKVKRQQHQKKNQVSTDMCTEMNWIDGFGAFMLKKSTMKSMIP